MLRSGFKSKEIIAQYNVSNSTISRIRKCVKHNEFPPPPKVFGSPPILSRREERLLLFNVRKNNFRSIKRIAFEFSSYTQKTISRDTIRRILKRHFIQSRYTKRKPMTSKLIKKKDWNIEKSSTLEN